MQGQLNYVPQWQYYFGGLADKIQGAVIPLDKKGYFNFTRHEPVGVVIAIDISRTLASVRAARQYSSPALASNALHFASDLVGTLAVLAGLVAVRAGWQAGDSLAALFVAFLVIIALMVTKPNIG